VIVLEKAVPGGQVNATALVENYPGFPQGVDGPDLMQRLVRQARRFGAEVLYPLEVSGVRAAADGRHEVLVGAAVFRAPAVIVAAGSDYRLLEVPGAKELVGRGLSYCATCDGPFFRGKKVVVVGGGDAAVQESVFLTRFVTSVTLVHRRDQLRAHALLQTEVKSNPKIQLVWNTVVEEILGKEKVEGVRTRNVVTNEKSVIPCDGIFIFIGETPNTGFIGDALPVCMGGHICTDENMRSQIEGVYAIGDVRGNSYRQVATAVGEGCTAAIAIYHWLQEKQAEQRVEREHKGNG